MQTRMEIPVSGACGWAEDLGLRKMEKKTGMCRIYSV